MDRITTEGTVQFVQGVAENFTKEQADVFNRIPGYEVKNLKDGIHPDLKDEVVDEVEALSDVTETPELPTPSNKLKDIISFANAQGVNIDEVNISAKKPVLEAIYAHFGK